MASPFYLQRAQIGLELEATEGTGESLVDADVIHPAFDIEWTPDFQMFERDNMQASFSRIPQVPGERSAQVSFATEVKGSGVAGTAPIHLADPLQACGFSETIVGGTSVTYAPVSEDVKSCTIEIREGSGSTDFKSKQIIGARGTVVFEAVKGDIVLARFTFTGRYVEPTDTTAFTAPAVGQAPEAFLGAAFSFQGVGSLKVQNVTLDIGNDIQLRNDASQATGNFSSVLVGRSPVGAIDPEQELVGTINFFNQLTTSAEGILTYVLGSTAGNITTFTAPKAQIIGIAEGDRNGIRTEDIDLQLNQSIAAGDDELTIVFT